VADFIGESNIFTGKMSGRRKVRFCGAEFDCLDDLPVGADVDTVVRPEDVVVTMMGNGQIQGVVQDVIFKGMHYEIVVQSGNNEIRVKSTKIAEIGKAVGLQIEPDGIHVIHAETNLNLYDGEITGIDRVAFADGEFECDITQLYPGSSISEHALHDQYGHKINVVGTPVTVKVPVKAPAMSDDIDAGGTRGNIISLIYKGDHYHYIVRTKSGEDVHLHDQSLWNEDDYVSIIIPKASIQLSLRAEAEHI
jgi:spermidine/putrescine transport system ATP-binding protein